MRRTSKVTKASALDIGMPLFKHQQESIKRLQKNWLLFDMSDPGTGKTRVQIETFVARRRKGGGRAIVFAPKSLLDAAWKEDFHKFAPDISVVCAYASNRNEALASKADVVVTNHDAVKALVKLKPAFWKDYDTLIIDESTTFKHHTSQRSRAMAKLACNFKYRSLMSGTPTSNGILDIWHQMFILDGGQRLGKSYFGFRNAACYPEQVGPSSQMVKWHDKPGVNLVVSDMLKDVSIRHAFEDCVDIPENYRYAVSYRPSKKHQAAYDDMQDFHYAQLAKTGVTAINGAVVYTKLLQIACLAGGTEVFTDHGWKSIETVTDQDQLWDGIEWVNSYGSTCSGYTTVIDCDGVAMTHDHKVLTIFGWATAKEIQDGYAYGQFDRETVRPPDGFETLWGERQKEHSLVDAVSMRKSSDSYWLKFKEWKSTISKILWVQPKGSATTSQRHPSSKSNSNVLPLEQHQITMQQPQRQGLQKLRWSWNNRMQAMGKFIREFSCRYGAELQNWFDSGSQKQRQRVFQNELPLGYCSGTKQQHSGECMDQYTQRQNDCGASCRSVQSQTHYYPQANGTGQQGYSSPNKIAVYDILNSGPRHRFVVRGKTGKIFIVHNSGAVYDDSGAYSLVDTGRYEMIMDLVEAREHSIVFFNWEHQRDELIKEAKVRKFSYAVFDGSTSDKQRTDIVRDYQRGNYKVLLAHPASAGHGLTLTRGTATIWASPTYNLEHFLQGLKRIHRIGQTEKTETIVVVAEGTIDEKVWLVLKDKDAKQGDLLGLLKEEVK